jgi:hypothetical protein
MIMRSAKVPLSPSSALQTIYFWCRLPAVRSCIQHGLPLDAGREARAAAPAQAGLRHFLDDIGLAHANGLGQAREAVMRLVIVKRQRIGDADTRESQPLLFREEGNVFRVAEEKRVGGMLDQAQSRVEQSRHILCRHRPIGDPSIGGLHLDHGLEPEHAA